MAANNSTHHLEDNDGVTSSIRSLLNIGYPIIFSLTAISYAVALLTLMRRQIRRYSSSIYLIFMLVGDLMAMCGHIGSRWALATFPDVTFSDGQCMAARGISGAGRTSASMVVLILALERVLVLSHPKKMTGLATPKMALVVSLVNLVVSFGLRSYAMHDWLWRDSIQECGYQKQVTRSSAMITQQSVVFAVALSTIIGQIVLNIILGILLYRKKAKLSLDPINSSLSAARQHTNQLNKINLICFLMSVVCFFTNIPPNVSSTLRWAKVFQRMSSEDKQIFNHGIMVSFVLLNCTKPILIAIASPKIRREAVLALQCAPENAVVRRLIKSDKSEKDLKPDTVNGESRYQ